tara:strand:- start:1481 stop:2155 length:675 start_codon:yes stop_codon:yes gene_type:complete
MQEATKIENVNDFERLYKVNVNDFKEKKGRFTYLSWAFALAEVKKRHPDTSWKVTKFKEKSVVAVDGNMFETERTVPFMRDSQGFTFVEVKVMINGLELPEVFPVLDNRNKSVKNPDSFEVNKAIKRALTKCFANFGLGLYIYAGEDLPELQETRIDGSVPKQGEGTVEQYLKMDRLIRNVMFSDEETKEYKDWMYKGDKYPSMEECDRQIKILQEEIKERKNK